MNKIYLVLVLLLSFNLSIFGQFPGTPYFTNSTAVLQPPTIGTATAGYGKATITYTAPASNGGAEITSYIATSSPGGFTGTVSQAGSGVITVITNTGGTAYTFTVRAVNAAGIGPPSAPSNSVTPLDNVIIGTGVWTNKNLDVTTYNDGTVIPQVTNPTAWAALTTGAWCYINNDAANGTSYGKLYNWYAVAGIHDNDPSTPNKVLAPTGWHIPTDAEWTSLTTFVGGESIAGGKMKQSGTTYWTSPNTGATDDFAFSARQGGYRDSNGSFAGFVGYWWSSSELNATNVWARYLNYNTANAYRINYNKAAAFSVRCLRSGAPALTTTPISAITSTTASTGGSWILDGGDTVTERGICWSTSSAPTVALSTKTTEGTGTVDFTSVITGLRAATTYYVRAYATNSFGTSYGNVVSFTTNITIGSPTVTTKWAYSVYEQDRLVLAGGTVTSIGAAPITARGVCWGTGPNPTVDLTTKTNDMMVPSNTSYNSAMTGLPLNKDIYYRAYVTNSFGTNYGLESSFRLVLPTVPDVTTYTPSDVRSTSVFVGGSVANNTSSDTVRGVCWSTSTGPTVALTTKKVAGTTGTGGFSILITTLAVNTTYFIRAFATNNVGTGYGEEYTFTTTGPANAPTIGIATIGVSQATITYTAPVFNGGYIIRSYTATSSPGGLTGTVYQTGSGSITVSGLTHGTAYTFTVKADNYYGASAASAASNAVVPISPSVVIGTQIWQSDNLAVSTYSDGTIIPQVTNQSAWQTLTTGAWCYYDNSLGNASLGKLYNWYAVAGIHDNDPSTPNKKLAPAGWHVPLDSEWSFLSRLYSRELKSTTIWRQHETLFGNEILGLYPLMDTYGFTAEPFGGRFGVFGLYTKDSYWWTGSAGGSSSATGIRMYYDSANVSYNQYSDKNWGHYVRCVKD